MDAVTGNGQSATHKPRIALVLQGGGALGAYQAGVYQALHEHDLAPDWIVGTSIGAINGAIIAGNPRTACLDKLRAFWHGIAHDDMFDMYKVPDPLRQLNIMVCTFDTLTRGVPGFFTPPAFNPFAFNWPVAAEAAGFYGTGELEETLLELVDFDYLNSPEAMRLTVSAIKVTSGQSVDFDTRHVPVGIKHVMASGALPPGFPPVRIDGELYWDGGLYSNTPLESVLIDEPRVDTVCFMVDLWSADGPEPVTLEQVHTRQKDVLYASRSRRHIDAWLRGHRLRRLVHLLREKIPDEQLSEEELAEIDAVGLNTSMQIVRLAYSGRDWQMASKDINFSRGSLEWRWNQGYQDALRAIGQDVWRAEPPEETGILVHEFGLTDHSEKAKPMPRRKAGREKPV